MIKFIMLMILFLGCAKEGERLAGYPAPTTRLGFKCEGTNVPELIRCKNAEAICYIKYYGISCIQNGNQK